MSNARQVNDRRQELTEGLRQVLLTDLRLQLGLQEFARRGADQLRIEWPEFFVDTHAQSSRQQEDRDTTSPVNIEAAIGDEVEKCLP